MNVGHKPGLVFCSPYFPTCLPFPTIADPEKKLKYKCLRYCSASPKPHVHNNFNCKASHSDVNKKTYATSSLCALTFCHKFLSSQERREMTKEIEDNRRENCTFILNLPCRSRQFYSWIDGVEFTRNNAELCFQVTLLFRPNAPLFKTGRDGKENSTPKTEITLVYTERKRRRI